MCDSAWRHEFAKHVFPRFISPVIPLPTKSGKRGSIVGGGGDGGGGGGGGDFVSGLYIVLYFYV